MLSSSSISDLLVPEGAWEAGNCLPDSPTHDRLSPSSAPPSHIYWNCQGTMEDVHFPIPLDRSRGQAMRRRLSARSRPMATNPTVGSKMVP
jgi:hypothetical protein